MDPGSIIVLAVDVLLLCAGWLLFQQAKSDLTARAAQIPILSEVKSLQKSIAALLEQLKLESAQASAQLESRCTEARDLLIALERRLEDVEAAVPRKSARRRTAAVVSVAETASALMDSGAEAENPRHRLIYGMSDDGLAPGAIAQKTGFPQGEVELILGLRRSAR